MRYSMPGVTGGTAVGDTAVLASARSRKELRSAVDVKLVKMEAGVSDARAVEWDVVWGRGEDEDEEEVEVSELGDGDGEEEEKVPARRPEKRKVSFLVDSRKRRRQ